MDGCGGCSTLREEIERLRRENAVIMAKLMRYTAPYSSSSVLSKPHEVLLDIVHCVDFNTLVPLRFTNSIVLECVNRHAHRLARERQLEIQFTDDGIEVTDDDDESWSLKVKFNIQAAMAVHAARPIFDYDEYNVYFDLAGFAERARTFFGCKPSNANDVKSILRITAHHAGRHRIVNVDFWSGYWLKVPFQVFYERIPAIRFARWIRVTKGPGLRGREDVANFVASFVRLERLELVDWRASSFDWRILRGEAFRRLTHFFNLVRPTMEDVSESCVNELCGYLSCVVHINRSRTVNIERGWKPHSILYKIAKVIGDARGPTILTIPAERPQLIPLFGAGTGWCGYRSVYRIHDALLLDDGDDADPGCSSVLSKPHEVLLDIIRCVDFNTLVPLRFTNSVVWECVNRNAHRLARERNLSIAFTDEGIEMTDRDDESCSLKVECHIAHATPVRAAYPMRLRLAVRAIALLGVKQEEATDVEGVLRAVGHEAGCHRIFSADFWSGFWLKVPFEAFSEAIPAIKFAPWLRVNNGRTVRGCEDVGNFVDNFVRLEKLHLVDWRAPNFDWEILRIEALRRLTALYLERPTMEHVSGHSADELCGYLSDVAHLNRSRNVRIQRGWTLPQIEFHRIAKVQKNRVTPL